MPRTGWQLGKNKGSSQMWSWSIRHVKVWRKVWSKVQSVIYSTAKSPPLVSSGLNCGRLWQQSQCHNLWHLIHSLNPTAIFRPSTFSLIRPKSRYVSIQSPKVAYFRAFCEVGTIREALRKARFSCMETYLLFGLTGEKLSTTIQNYQTSPLTLCNAVPS